MQRGERWGGPLPPRVHLPLVAIFALMVGVAALDRLNQRRHAGLLAVAQAAAEDAAAARAEVAALAAEVRALTEANARLAEKAEAQMASERRRHVRLEQALAGICAELGIDMDEPKGRAPKARAAGEFVRGVTSTLDHLGLPANGGQGNGRAGNVRRIKPEA